jgi:CheY-like chemotaxis protein
VAAGELRILIVEDDPDFAELLELLLIDLGHSVSVVLDGRQALERAGSFAPDVVLIDIGLPGMDGYQVARALRSAGGPQAKLVALSGYGEREHRQAAQAAGFDHYLVKPLREDTLVAILAGFRSEPVGAGPSP